MKKTLIIYFIFSLLVSCENKKKVNTIIHNTDVVSSEKVYTPKELKGKTYEELRFLRNEIFAKKGYVFKDSVLNNYFQKKDWYKPNKDAEIVLDSIEKKNIETFKIAEANLMPFDIPKGYEAIDKVTGDIDKDGITDTIQSVKNKDGSSELILIYLSTKSNYQKIALISGDEFDGAHPHIELKGDILTMEILNEGSGHFIYSFDLKYNPKIKNLQLTTYTSSNRIMYGHTAKKYDLIKGSYEVTTNASTISDPENFNTTTKRGVHNTKIITPDLFNQQLYFYLDNIGKEFEEDNYPEYYYGEYLDCREAIVEKIALEFEYGALNYLGAYSVFKKELKDFVKNINIDELVKSEDDTYSKTYKLHRNWDLDYIAKDDCEDELFLIFDINTNTFSIQINNCSLVYEYGEVIHASEQSIMLVYNIETNCTYKFKKIEGAG
ncbi:MULTISPECIES: YARHG domain-containing protein [unclassified Cellulophaga]|uniref:YARHG domain-containing protein n=1 Tax=unclassified Cellulophaga TaxID=2634405 RepID=UPI0026E16384|nr:MULTISPECIES: YARHG domain-containing protein [unclassified Cellulophaga]MDO6490101.1 YARHG domain-containing protein [Cellulophaga sp. 2_MG-2023]MDO6494705.1 YARHG domain-containing protein [Cellulophaga sp. 3_MG-2023]